MRPSPAVLLIVPVLSACATLRGGDAADRVFVHRATYRISCSVSDECRVTWIDQDGELRSREIVGEWRLELGADPGMRLWVRAGAGGCPPRPVRVEILIDGTPVAEDLARGPGGERCDWILAETEFRVP